MTNLMQPFIEDVVQAVLDSLTAKLPTQLTATVAKYAAADSAASRTVPLLVPNGYIYGEHENTGIGLPVLFAWSPDASFGGFYVANSDHGSADYEIVVIVEVHLGSDSEEIVERQYSRYGEAILSVLYPTQDLAGNAVTVKPKRLQRLKSNGAASRILHWEVVVSTFSDY